MIHVTYHNDVLTCIRRRRSTRSFTSEQISPEQLDALLDAAVWAPSGSNNQSWLFTAVQKHDVLLRLNEVVREAFLHWTPDDDYPGKQGIKERVKNDGYNFYYNSPTLIVASNKPNYQNAMADCALAMQNIFLAAESIGLGSCYINQLFWLRNEAAVRDYLSELGIPKEHVICNAAAIGYIANETPAPARKDGTVNIIR
jgi:nitroreductase